MAIVIVEGVDGAGKTTLLRNLREVSPTYFWIASSSGRAKNIAELQEALFWIGQCQYLKLPVLCDRFPLSEMVYGPMMRGTSLLDQLSPRNAEDYTCMLEEGCDRVIYCRPPREIIKDNLFRHPQMIGVDKKLDRLLDVYDDLMVKLKMQTGLHIVKYDYTQPQEYDLHELVFGAKKNG